MLRRRWCKITMKRTINGGTLTTGNVGVYAVDNGLVVLA